MGNIGNANKIKALLIDFIERDGLIKDCVFGNELFYGSKKRQTDLLAVNGSTTAFEIKSKRDNLKSTRVQLDDYKKVFDYQYLVTTRSHEKMAKKILKHNEGLIIIEESDIIKIIRKPKKISRHNKIEILETMPISFLKKHFEIDYKIKRAHEVRRLLKEKNTKELKLALMVFFKERLTPRNILFFEEKGEVIHFEDLKLLTQNSDYIL